MSDSYTRPRRSALSAVQRAIFDRLSSRLAIPVYDEAPGGAGYPYVTLGEATATDWGCKTCPGQQVTCALHVWSQYPGMREVTALMDEMIQAITEAPLHPGEGVRIVALILESQRTGRLADGVTRHGVVRLRLATLDEPGA